MLIGLLFALIFGGAESEFASSIPHIKREIKQSVPDKSRKDELLSLVKSYEKEIKKYEKEKNRMLKKLNKNSTDRDKTSDDFLMLYEDYYQVRTRLISALIDYRLLFQQQITEEELLLISEEAMISTKKERRKDEKQEEKLEDKLNKVFLDIKDVVIKHINDTAKSAIVIECIYDFESTIYAHVDEAHDLSVERQLMLDDKNAAREEFEELYEKSNQLRCKASKDFAELRDEIIKNTDKREWKDINKELKVFLK